MKKTVALFGIGLILGIVLVLGYKIVESKPEFHKHVDFALFLNGKQFDFSGTEFMHVKPCVSLNPLLQTAYAHKDSEGGDLTDAVDLHDNVGTVIHVHQAGIAYHDFFESLGMTFEDARFVDPKGNELKNNETHSFRFFLNEKEAPTLANTEIRDLDRVLIAYGPRNRSLESIQAELGQITNDSCVASGKCPHRPAPVSTESCGKE